MDRSHYAYSEAARVPGGQRQAVRHVLRIRAQRVRRLIEAGLTSREIQAQLGLTYRQQRYAVRHG